MADRQTHKEFVKDIGKGYRCIAQIIYYIVNFIFESTLLEVKYIGKYYMDT